MNQPQIAVALPNADNHFLDACRTPAALLATNIGFVNLYRAAQLLALRLLHGLADAMAEIPCRLIAHSDGALESGRPTCPFWPRRAAP